MQFSELVLAAQEARARLQSLECFKAVEILIDTSEDGGSKDYEVTFDMTEIKRVQGAINTMVGNQEGSLTGGIKFPNILSPWIIKLILCHFACYDVTASSSRS